MGKRSKNRGPERVDITKSGRENSSPTAASRSKKGRAIADPMPQIIARIPQRGATRKEWDKNITVQLRTLWRDRMPPADLKNVSTPQPSALAGMSKEAIAMLDEIIVRQAATLGWRIGLSTLVHRRLSEWERRPDGLKLMRRYHCGIERAAEIFQRSKKPPLNDPDLYSFKVETVKELKVLLSEMRDAFQARLSDPPVDLEPVVVAHFLKTIKRRSRSLPHLAANYSRWEAFFKVQPTVLRQHLSEVRPRPASLFYSWFSWCKGVDDEWLRQVISRLGSSLRKPIRNAKL